MTENNRNQMCVGCEYREAMPGEMLCEHCEESHRIRIERAARR